MRERAKKEKKEKTETETDNLCYAIFFQRSLRVVVLCLRTQFATLRTSSHVEKLTARHIFFIRKKSLGTVFFPAGKVVAASKIHNQTMLW